MTDHPNTITLDLDTGQWVAMTRDGKGVEPRLVGEEAARVASSVLPGTDGELIEQWYETWMEADPVGTPFAEGAQVRPVGDATSGPIGIVRRRVEAGGELHTVWVAWPHIAGDMPLSPGQIVEVPR
jgi:hypothetical protein